MRISYRTSSTGARQGNASYSPRLVHASTTRVCHSAVRLNRCAHLVASARTSEAQTGLVHFRVVKEAPDAKPASAIVTICASKRDMRLYRRSADMDIARGSMTPLHIGAYWGHHTIARLLCERGANPLLQTTTRKLAMDLVPPEADFNKLRAYLQGITAAAQLTAKDGLTTVLNGIAIVAVRSQTTSTSTVFCRDSCAEIHTSECTPHVCLQSDALEDGRDGFRNKLLSCFQVLVVTVTFIGFLNPPGGVTDSGHVRFAVAGAPSTSPEVEPRCHVQGSRGLPCQAGRRTTLQYLVSQLRLARHSGHLHGMKRKCKCCNL